MRCAACVLCFMLMVSAAQAQWLPPFYEHAEADGGTDRPHLAKRANRHIVMSARPEIPNWIFPNVNVTQDPLNDQTEPSVTVTQGARKIIIGANDDRNLSTLYSYSSSDYGATWTAVPVPMGSNLEYATDPSLVYYGDSVAYYLFGRMDGFGLPFPRNEVACYSSRSNGIDWEKLTDPFSDSLHLQTADTLSDKYYLAIDRSPASPYRGTLYATWVDQGADDTLTRIVFSRSANGGRTWSRRIYLTADKSFYHAPVPTVTSEGTVLVSYIDLAAGRKRILVVRSVNGGVSFQQPNVISTYHDLGPVEPNNDSRGYPVIKQDVAVNSFPSIAADLTNTHNAYVTWAGKGSDNRSHVFLSRSRDAGVSWEAPVTIDNDTSSIPTDKFFTWVAVDPQSGSVGVVFYDSRTDPTNALADLFMSYSRDSGSTFHTRRISNASSDPRRCRATREVKNFTFQFFGDYINVAADSDHWRPVWTDSRSDADLDIYSADVQPMAPMPVDTVLAVDTLINGVDAILLRWHYTPQTTFGYALSEYQFAITQNGAVLAVMTSADSLYTILGPDRGHAFRIAVRSGGASSIPVIVRSPSMQVKREPAGVGSVVRKGNELVFSLEAPSSMQLTVYDLLGREVARISSSMSSTEHHVALPDNLLGPLFYAVRCSAGESHGLVRTIQGE